jgi:hypothetical protein
MKRYGRNLPFRDWAPAFAGKRLSSAYPSERLTPRQNA